MIKKIIITIISSFIALSSICLLTGCSDKKTESTETTIEETTITVTYTEPVTSVMPKIEIENEELME